MKRVSCKAYALTQRSQMGSIVAEQKAKIKKECIGRSAGGLSTKIHAIGDALGNPTQFYLTPGEAHDLNGADALLPNIEAESFLADRANGCSRKST